MATTTGIPMRAQDADLYVNRGSTGAKVGRQPFGGSKLSGTGPKAGGPDYLTAFGDAHVVTENTVRHGLMIEWARRREDPSTTEEP